jgi:hypothetical protein
MERCVNEKGSTPVAQYKKQMGRYLCVFIPEQEAELVIIKNIEK